MSTPRVRLKYACVSRGKYGLNYPATGYVNQGIRLIRTTDLAGGVLLPEELGIYVPEGAVDDESRLMPGDLLLSRSGTIGRAFLAPPATEGMAFAGFLVRFRPKPDTLGKYIYYCTQSNEFQAAVNADAVSSTIQNFNAEKYENLAIPLPELDEQRAIADFLDRETRKIDELIDEQRGLIVTLQERRRSLVLRAVTLGIDGEDLKDARDRSIGDVPLGWEIRPLKGWMKSLDGARIPLSATQRADRPGVYDYYGASGVIDHVDDYLFDEPLILVSEDGANLLMRSTPIAFTASGKYWVNNHAHVFRPDDGEVRFWSERIEAVDVAPFVTGSAQPKLTAGALGRIRLSAPADLAERRRISDYLDEQTPQIDELISESEDLIALSEERRSALITAAVTGQIDVRTTV